MSRRTHLAVWLTVVFLLVGVLLIKIPTFANLYINSLIREINKRGLVWYHARGTNSLGGERFVVFYQDGQQREAAVVLDAAEGFYPVLARNFGFDIQGPVPVLLYAEREALNQSFGWPADANTVGVYWAGSIRVLSPAVWIDPLEAEADYDRYFHEMGPMAHEIAHLFVDYLSRGNCPRWFNEGVAQYQEYLLTGFQFGEPRFFPLENAYTLEELQYFDQLEDQNLAYLQCFSLVYFLVEQHGWPVVVRVLEALGRGASLATAMQDELGLDLNTLDGEWKRWAAYQEA
jgi:hypothetical protein